MSSIVSAKAWRAVAATAALAVCNAGAQEYDPLIADLAEGLRLVSTLEAGVNYTDNFFYTDDTRGQDDGSGLLVRPSALLTRTIPRFQFQLGGNAELAWFDLPSNADDYTDYKISLGAAWQSATRHRFGFSSSYVEDHDPFGTERTENTPLEDRELDQWSETRTDLSYRYGLPSQRYNVEFRVYGLNKEYSTNRDFTQFLDHERVSGQALAFYNFTSRASVFLNYYAGRTMYETVAPNGFDRSSIEQRYALGTRWLASAKTIGDLRVGYVTRSPRDASRDDFGGLYWNAGLTWSPQIVRSLTLQTGRASQESFLNTVDFIDNSYVGLAWTEQWSQRAQTTLGGRYQKSDFVGTQREDRSMLFTFDYEYLLLRNLKLLASLSSTTRDSNLIFAEYDRLLAYVGARYSR